MVKEEMKKEVMQH